MADKDTPKNPNPENSPQDKGKGDGLVGEVTGVLKHMFGFDLNAAISLADPQMRQMAEKLADELDQKLPADSWVRGRFAEILLDQISSRIESAGDKSKSKVTGAVTEKLADFFDRFTSAFFRKQKGSKRAEEKQGQPPSPKPAPTAAEIAKISDIKAKWLEDAFRRLSAASPADLPALQARLQQEQETLAKIEKIMREGLPEAEKEKPADKDKTEEPKEKKGVMRLIAEWFGKEWREEVQELREVNGEFKTKLDQWEARQTEKIGPKTPKTPWQPSGLTKLLRWPWFSLFRNITGIKKPENQASAAARWEAWCRS